MNFTPPQAWLRPRGPNFTPGPDASSPRTSARGRVALPPAPLAADLGLPPWLRHEATLPGSAQWREGLGADAARFALADAPAACVPGAHARGGVDCVVGDFTARAMQLAHLRFVESARRGALLADQRGPADLLDASDPRAVHVVALRRGEAVASVRLLGLGDTVPSWTHLVTGRHAERLRQLTPAVELAQLVAQEARPAWQAMRALGRAAVYLALAAGRRHVVVVARPHEARFWGRLGFARTGLGSYVPSARPHVVELFVLDAVGSFCGAKTSPVAWHHLFGGLGGALARLPPPFDAGSAPTGWRGPLCRGLGRALDGFARLRGLGQG